MGGMSGRQATLIAASAVATILFMPRPVRAEPYLSVRTGMRCSQCHVNVTGGGKRTAFGVVYAQTMLPYAQVSSDDLRSVVPEGASYPDVLDSTFFSGAPADWLSLGANFRVTNANRFRDLDDDVDSSFQITEANLYLQVDPVAEFLTFYLDETVAPGGAAAREAVGIVRGLPWGGYIKAGRFMPAFGWRVRDDETFARQVTGFNFGVQDIGVEIGLEPGPFTFSLSFTNGTAGGGDDNKDKQTTARLELVRRHIRLGVSASWNNGPTAKLLAYGGFAGLHYGRFTALAELDQVVAELRPAAGGEDVMRQIVLLTELDVLLVRGVNLKGTFDWLDPDQSVSEDERSRYGLGVEVFVTQFSEVSVFYRFLDVPQGDPDHNDRQLVFELHLFF